MPALTCRAFLFRRFAAGIRLLTTDYRVLTTDY